MTPDNKPEWFKLAETDNSASTRKISKGLPIMALVAVAAIIGVGAIFAQPQEQTPASATETVAPAVVDSTQTSASSESVAPSKSDVPTTATSNSQSVGTATEPVAAKTPSAPGVANPLAKKPKGGEREGHEGGEHGDDEEEGEDD